MYFILLFLCSWIWFFVKADRSRFRELYGVMVYASFLGLMTDLMMVHYKLWAYYGLPQSKFTIPLLLDFSIYPVVGFLFVQNLDKDLKGVLKRTLVWSVLSVLFEWVTLLTKHIEHDLWWNLWYSAGSDVLIYLSTWGIYRAYRPAFKKKQY